MTIPASPPSPPSPKKPSPSPDMADALKGGASLLALVQAADASPGLDVSGLAERERRARESLAALSVASADLSRAETPAERAQVLSRLVAGPVREGLMYAESLHPREVDAALTILSGVKGLAVDAARLRKGLKKEADDLKIRDRAVSAEKASTATSRARLLAESLAPLLGNHSLPPGLAAPSRHKVTPSGVWVTRVSEDGEESSSLISPSPLVLVGVVEDIETGLLSVTLDLWREGRGWATRTFPRSTVASSREIVGALSGWGVFVDSGSAADLVRYLSLAEAENLALLPKQRSASRMGWQPDGSFLAGESSWGGTGGAPVSLVAEDPSLVEAMRPVGTWEGWCSAWEGVMEFPSAALAIYAALVPPLLDGPLRTLGAPLFVLDYSGSTTQGKTSCARLAASVWASPAERGGYIQSWRGTAVGIEGKAVFFSGLPLILDETKNVDPRLLARAVYEFCAGVGKTRGKKEGGNRPGKRWASVMISTGEHPLSHYSEGAGGDRARTLSLRPPFFPVDGAREIIDAALSGVSEHYGHLGPRWIAWLVEDRGERWEYIRSLYRDSVTYYAAQAPSAVAGRAASYLALLYVAGQLAHAFLGLPVPENDPLVHAMALSHADAEEAPPVVRAMQLLGSWAGSHAARFWGAHEETRGDPVVPSAGWAGRWDLGKGGLTEAVWSEIGFLPHVFDEILTRAGFSPSGILQDAEALGWLKGGVRQRKAQVTIHRGRQMVYLIRRVALEGKAEEGGGA